MNTAQLIYEHYLDDIMKLKLMLTHICIGLVKSFIKNKNI